MIKKKQTVKRASLSNGLRIPQIKHGSTTITLEDVITGEKKVYHDDNMQTNGINEYLRNCGWLNRDNLTQSDLVTQLLGGIMLFNTAMTEDADIVKVPSEEKMIANSYMGASNLTQEPSELGSFLSDQSGWDANHKVYTAVYHWLQAQGNCTQDTGPIACVCAVPQSYGHCGNGNGTSHVRYGTRINMTTLKGAQTSYSGFSGQVFHVDLDRAICYTFDLTGASESHKGILRKYRIPTTKINIAMTPSLPVQLPVEYDQSDDPVYNKEITVPEAMYSAGLLYYQPLGEDLLIWNADANSDHTWGTNYTQYLWTLETDGTLAEETLLNTSGDTLHGIQNALFDGDYCFFVPTNRHWYDSSILWGCDTRTIYIMKRSTGTIVKLSNPYGGAGDHWNNPGDYGRHNSGFNIYSANGNGRIITQGAYPFIIDAVEETVEPINMQASVENANRVATLSPLIRHSGTTLYRDQAFISTINNLSEPVTKDPSKAMTVQYRFEFEDDDLWDVEEAQNG